MHGKGDDACVDLVGDGQVQVLMKERQMMSGGIMYAILNVLLLESLFKLMTLDV